MERSGSSFSPHAVSESAAQAIDAATRRRSSLRRCPARLISSQRSGPPIAPVIGVPGGRAQARLPARRVCTCPSATSTSSSSARPASPAAGCSPTWPSREATGVRWAAAARDAGKLGADAGRGGGERRRDDRRGPRRLGVARGDGGAARVVLNLVGPYTLHGAAGDRGMRRRRRPLRRPHRRDPVRAADDRQLRRARRGAGVKIVQVSGSRRCRPTSWSCWRRRQRDERWDEGLARLDSRFRRPLRGLPHPSDLLSGGTLQSHGGDRGR